MSPVPRSRKAQLRGCPTTRNANQLSGDFRCRLNADLDVLDELTGLNPILPGGSIWSRLQV